NAIDNVLKQPDFKIERGFVFCNSNIQVQERITYYPVYMLMFLQKKAPAEDILFETDFSDLDQRL
ncbi:MAG: AAA family ATPase, partial [Firmicutes bacterium]|nr:AAA family ATPase [Bacillota bacterium]